MRIALICLMTLSLSVAATAGPIAPPDPIAGWLFDDGAGTTVTDSFGLHDGTLQNPNGDEWDSTNKKFGAASLKFDDDSGSTTSDHVTIPGFDYYNDAAGFTLSFWFRVTDNSGTGFQYVFSHATYDTPGSINVWMVEDGINPAGKVRTGLRDGNDASTTLVDSATALDDGGWHLYVMTVGVGTGTKVFVDGDQVGSTVNGADAFTPSGSIYLGMRNDNNATRRLDGWMDEVILWDQPLTQDNIDWLWNDGAGHSLSVVPAPEPTTLCLLAFGGVTMAMAARRRRLAKA